MLAAPQQILARQESQGPQASLTALSAGIQQMESAPAMVKVAAEFKKSDMKGSLDEVGKPGGVGDQGGGTDRRHGLPAACPDGGWREQARGRACRTAGAPESAPPQAGDPGRRRPSCTRR